MARYSKESREKISKALKGRKRTDEQLAKLRAYHLTRRSPRETRKCLVCGKEFVCVVKATKMCCSHLCGNRWKRHKTVPWVTRNCLVCGTEFTNRSTSKQKYCSWDCSARNARSHRKPISNATREKLSKSISKRYLEGKHNPYWFYKSGWLYLKRLQVTLHHRSSYEKKGLQILDSIEEVVMVGTERIRIPYDKKGSVHNFLPDFLVITSDGKNYLVEVKSKDFLYKRSNQLKYLSALEYCKKNDFIFLIWTENMLFSSNNGSQTALSWQVIAEATAATFSDGKVMIQSELHGNMERQEETTCPPIDIRRNYA